MEILLDTHTLLWFYNADSQLSVKVKDIITYTENTCYLSIASLWEITIKYSIGKLELENNLDDLFQFINRNQIIILPIEFGHLLKLNELPLIHRDPFDRIIIAQSIYEKLKIASKDVIFTQYEIDMFW